MRERERERAGGGDIGKYELGWGTMNNSHVGALCLVHHNGMRRRTKQCRKEIMLCVNAFLFGDYLCKGNKEG